MLALGIGLHDDEYGSNASDGGTFSPMPGTSTYSARQLHEAAAALGAQSGITGEVTAIYNFDPPTTCADPPARLRHVRGGLSPGHHPAPVRAPGVAELGRAGRRQRLRGRAGGSRASSCSGVVGLRPVGRQHPAAAAHVRQHRLGAGRSLATSVLIVHDAAAPTSCLQIIDNVDLAKVQPGLSTKIAVTISFEGFPSGTYTVYLWAPEPSPTLMGLAPYALLFENVGVGDPTTGLNTVATIKVAAP